MSVIATVLCAFGSGVLGAGLGAVVAVVMTAFMALAGIASAIAGADYSIVSNLAFGMFLGPQVSFGPACCAAAYAWKKGYMEDAGDIFKPLACLAKPDVLIVGGIFAVIGWYLNVAIASVANGGIDTVALAVVLISILAKTIFGGSPIGTVADGKKRFAMDSPCWLPYQTSATPGMMFVVGGGVGLIQSYLVIAMCDFGKSTGNAAIAGVCHLPVWAIAVICFLAMSDGLNIPVFHHIGLCAGYATLMAYNAGAGEKSLLWGFAFGILSAYAGDILAKIFTVNGPGFVDPPSMSIAFCSVFALAIFPMMGADNPANVLFYVIPIAIVVLLAVYAVYCYGQVKKAN